MAAGRACGRVVSHRHGPQFTEAPPGFIPLLNLLLRMFDPFRRTRRAMAATPIPSETWCG